MSHGPRGIVKHIEEVQALRRAVPQGNYRSIGKGPDKLTPRHMKLRSERNVTIPKPKKPAEGKGKIGTNKSTGQPKSSLKEGSFLKKNGKEAAPKAKKQARLEAEAGSESD